MKIKIYSLRISTNYHELIKRYRKKFVWFVWFVVIFFFSCINRNTTQAQVAPNQEIKQKSQLEIDLEKVLSSIEDPFLYILVDKNNALPSDYEPDDLIPLTGRGVSYRINRGDMLLRKPAFDALEELAQGARSDGLTLLASSAYRSYEYQKQVYNRWVREYGQEEADTFSARAGHSQHQLGLVVDFGSITDEFADTPEGKWLAANAHLYGWSLSYPKGYEDVTGYKWESWHYRYVGKELAEYINKYFDGIQQLALEYINGFLNNN